VNPIETPRLVLRGWTDADHEPFARLNADPRVMRLMPRALSREESDAAAENIASFIAERGFGLYAAELKDDRAFLGFIGLSIPKFEAAFTPCVEIGWRLAADYWNRGLASEGARAVAEHAFRDVGLAELVSFTVPHNLASRRVMEKIGMTRDPAEDFDNPRLEPGHPLRRHVLYRLRAAPRQRG
jgi:RimJ/RimL family protein N-acetyltransferase